MDQAPPTRNEEPWNYCGKCGARMHWNETGKGFDRASGGECRVFVWTCPVWTLQSSRHDRASHTSSKRLAPLEDERH